MEGRVRPIWIEAVQLRSVPEVRNQFELESKTGIDKRGREGTCQR
jgi:hypothetical protein